MPLASLTPGTVFAREFRIERFIAEGGMGAVYRAEQRSTGSEVALKVMKPELLADPKSRERFQHEARVSGRIKSSHVARVLCAGIDDETQTPWLAMELIEGQSLAAVVARQGPMRPDAVWAVLQQVGHALRAAHSAGVVHCDLKPENILMGASHTVGVAFEVKVLDFGIARIVQEGRHSATVTTAIGSPHWLAPEQGARGRTVSPATDVWSFGLIAFWLLTGRYYWAAANVAAHELNMLHLLAEVGGSSALLAASERLRALDEPRALLPPGFDGWFARCVHREVARRFQSAHEAVEALGPVLAGAPEAPPSFAPTVLALPSVPAVGSPEQTREMTVGVAGLAPVGRLSGTGTEVIAEVARPHTPAAPDRRRWWVTGGTASAVVGVGLVFLSTRSTPDPRGPLADAATTALGVIAEAPAPPSTSTSTASSNQWINVASSGGVQLGVPAATPRRVHGLRPSRRESSPVTSFQIQQHEVTWGELGPWLMSHPSTELSVPADGARRDDRPAAGVPRGVARDYCASLGGALPRESEWEFAARGAALRGAPSVARELSLERVAVGRGPSSPFVAVMTSPDDVTPEGVHDLLGNVREWVDDPYRDDSPGPTPDAFYADPSNGQVIGTVRGMSARWTADDVYQTPVPIAWREPLCASGACAAYYESEPPGYVARLADVGFRCARPAR